MTENNDVGSNDYGERTQLTFRASKEDAEKWNSRVDNMSGSFREILESWNQVEEEHDIDDDTQRINEIVLQTYINAIDKHLVILENQREQLKEKLDEIQDEDEENEVLMKVDLDIEGVGYE